MIDDTHIPTDRSSDAGTGTSTDANTPRRYVLFDLISVRQVKLKSNLISCHFSSDANSANKLPPGIQKFMHTSFLLLAFMHSILYAMHIHAYTTHPDYASE